MKQIDLNEWEKAGEGVEADSYNNRKDDSIMLKLFKPNILKARIESSFSATNEYIKLGISTPKAYEMVETGDRIGIIYERIKNKISLYRMFVNDHSKDIEIGEIFGKALRDFHSHILAEGVGSSRLQMLNMISKGMISKAEFLSDEQKNNLLSMVDKFFVNFNADESDHHICMGDAHIGNVIMANDKLYFIDISSLLYATPLIDLGWLYNLNSKNTLALNAIPENERIPGENCDRFLDSFTKTYFEGINENQIEENVKKAKRYSKIQDLFLEIYVSKNYDNMVKILQNG